MLALKRSVGVNVSIPISELEEIDSRAKRMGVPRSRFIRDAIETALRKEVA